MIHIIVIIFAVIAWTCKKENNSNPAVPVFDTVPTIKQMVPVINEISGIADSKLNPGALWGQEDSGTPTRMYLIHHDGNVTHSVFIDGVTNRDWEEMALHDGNIFIAETGDNNEAYNNYKFYKFDEPTATTDTVQTVETINFTYPDGSHDSEAFIIDRDNHHIYIITKRDNPSRIYKLSYPFGSSNTASFIGTLPYSGVVGAAIAEDGKEVIIKTYTGLFYYTRDNNETMEQVFQKTYQSLPYTIEPQGEAICFSATNNGFFTVSEKSFASTVNVCFYKRN